MKTVNGNMFLAVLLMAALAVMVPQGAMALGTQACTPISNTATVAYTVGSVVQTPVTSAAATFTVGNKVNLTVVTTDAANVSVTPGATNRQLNFTVTNTGNATQRYVISLVTQPDSTASPFSGTDNFNATNPGINAVSVATVTTANIVPNGTYTATINADIDAGRVNGDIAVYGLVATTYKTDGTTIEAEGSGTIVSPAGSCTADIVFADSNTDADAGSARNGKDSARSAYEISSAQISFAKSATTIWDPINYNSSPKSIPGALVRYVLTVTNAAGATASATLTTITDTLTSTVLAIDPNLKVAGAGTTIAALANESGPGSGFKVVITGSSRTSGTTAYYTTTSDADGVEHDGSGTGGVIAANMATLLPVNAGGTGYTAGELKKGESVAITFNVVIQ